MSEKVKNEKTLFWLVFVAVILFIAAFILGTLIFCGVDVQYDNMLFDLMYLCVAIGLIFAMVALVIYKLFVKKQ